ncbi:Mediator of RNA polymerase II transcription subunit 7 [Yarrowia sp. C11]|nr:Mediator of RNA polymerase II transcription subunit 7 [Yarrowia sp. E02]KAG5372611.1 Mediator of RNA polymerase II transcription subunit 7 [Yarrowia sp. C11]
MERRKKQNEGLLSVYPPPPWYSRYFTDENVEKVKELQGSDNPELLEAPLKYLTPPSPPEAGAYHNFGDVWQVNDKLATLEDLGITQVYDAAAIRGEGQESGARVLELKKLTKSLLLAFVELTGIMGVAPEQFPTKFEHVRVLLINIHHILNEYRPHQARESLVTLMEQQISEKKQHVENIRESCEKVRETIRVLSKQFDQVDEFEETGGVTTQEVKYVSGKDKDLLVVKMAEQICK